MRAKATYNPELREVEVGQRLYAFWKRIRRLGCSPEFSNYPDFYNWAIEDGYIVGDKLLRLNADKPYSPDNCMWTPKKLEYKDSRDTVRERLWDDTVNRIRQHFGMEPIYSTEVSSD